MIRTLHTALDLPTTGRDDPGLDERSIASLLDLIEERDPALRVHSEAVARSSVAIGVELGLASVRNECLRRAALLHDVGKLTVPDVVLQKPGPLDEREYAIIRAHAFWGHRIISSMGWTRESWLVLHHHERPDGRGYPNGIRGDEIPLESSILHVADAFDALTTDRPYRSAQTPAAALTTIAAGAGTDFDADCVAVLASIALR